MVHVIRLGAQAGCVVGMFGGGVLLIAGRVQWPYRSAVRAIIVVTLGGLLIEVFAALISPLLPLSYPLLDVLDIAAVEQDSFYRVWAMHIGLYAGMVLALIWQSYGLFRLRRQQVD
jgi:hypothetical protein